MRLLLSALVKFVLGILLVGALLFLPAGTLAYSGAWLFLALLFIPMLIMGVVMLCKAPDLLRRRLDGKEKAATQRGVVGFSALMFLGGFIVSGLDFRFGWSSVPAWCVVAAAVLFEAGYAMYAEVMRENAYLSRTVEVQSGQTVVSTGLYGVVRHPMYLATLLMFLPMPLILGSFWGLGPFAIYPPLIIVRLLNEEKLLSAELEGYVEYKVKVKFRLIPFIW